LLLTSSSLRSIITRNDITMIFLTWLGFSIQDPVEEDGNEGTDEGSEPVNPEGSQVDAVVRVLDASSKLERSGNGGVKGGAVEAVGDAEDGGDEGETDGEAVVLVGALFGDAGVEVGCDDGISEGHFDRDGFPCLCNISCFGG